MKNRPMTLMKLSFFIFVLVLNGTLFGAMLQSPRIQASTTQASAPPSLSPSTVSSVLGSLRTPSGSHGSLGEVSSYGQVSLATLHSTFGSQTPRSMPNIQHDSVVPYGSKITSPFVVGNITSSSLISYPGFVGLNEANSGNWIPPDGGQVAVGGNFVMEAVNVQFNVYTRQGVLVKSVGGNQFFSAPGDFIGDPRVLFDQFTGRWFASVFDNNVHGALVAASTSVDPTGTWTLYSFISGGLSDQPIIGVTTDKLVLSINQYVSITGPFLGARWWVVNKNDMISGVSSPRSQSFGPYPSLESVHPVETLGQTSTMYMVSSGGSDIKGGSNRTAVFVVSVNGAPPGQVANQTVAVPVNTIVPTVLAPQKGTINTIDTGVGGAAGSGDARVQSAAWFQGRLWLTFPVSCTPTGDSQTRACFRLLQLDTTSMQKLQDFDVGLNGLYLFYPSLTIGSLGDLGVVYGFSSSTVFPSLGATGQLAGDPLNSFRQPLNIINGTSFDSSSRYGDYFSAARDPADQTLLWFSGEYHDISGPTCGTVNCWDTFVSSDRVLNSGFAMAANPGLLTLVPGISGKSSANVTSLSGFSGTVLLTAKASSTNIGVSMNPQQLTLSSNGFALSSIMVTTTLSTPPGLYLVQVNATGTVSGKQVVLPATLYVLVPAPDFTVSANPSSLIFNPASSPTSTISVSSIYNFAGTVGLADTVSPSGITVSLNPSSFTLSANQTGLSTLSLTSSSFGKFTVNVTATSGSLVHFSIVTITIGGLLCIMDPTTTSSSQCSGPAQIFEGPVTSPNTLLRVGVFTQGSNSILSMDITIIANHTILKPYGVDMTGSVLAPTNLLITCIGGVAIGNNCGAVDNMDTITVQAIPQTATAAPTTGLLFTAIYVIVGTAANLSIGFQTSSVCTNTSVPGTNYCAFLANTAAVTDYESLSVTPVFTNNNPSYVTLSASPTLIGPIVANAAGTSTITATAQNGWPGFSNDQVTFTTQQSTGLTASLPQGSCSTGGTSCSVTLQVNSAFAGTYTVTVFGTFSFFDLNTNFVSTLEAPVTLQVVVTDFSLSLSPTVLNIQQGASGTSTVSLSSLNGFAGAVALSSNSGLGITTSFNPSSVSLSSGGTGTSIFTVMVSSTTNIGNYTLTVTGRSGSSLHTQRITIQVSNFKISTSANTLLIPRGGSGTLVITATSVNGYAALVTPQINSGLPACVSYSFSPSPIQLPAHGAGTSKLTLSPGLSCLASTNIVSGQGNSGTFGYGFSFALNITDFSLSPRSTSLTVLAGVSGSSTITISPLSGFTGTVTLSSTVPTGLSCTLSPSTITLGSKQNATLSCSGSAGNYNVTVTGTSGAISNSVIVKFSVQDFNVSAPPGINCPLGGGRHGNICSFQVTVTSLNGFAGTVCMTSTAGSVSPSCVTLSAGGTQTATVTFSAGPSTVIVTYTSSSLSHQTSTHVVYPT